MAARVSMNQRALGHAFNIQDPRPRKSLEKNHQLPEKTPSTPEPPTGRGHPAVQGSRRGGLGGPPTASCGLFGGIGFDLTAWSVRLGAGNKDR